MMRTKWSTMMSHIISTIDTSDREIVNARVIDAPRDLVFSAWSDPRHITHWWGPRGFRTTTHSMDMRPGGVWRFTMHGPDGRDYENKVTYREVTSPERIVYDHEGVGADSGVVFKSTVTFEDLDGRTRMTFRMVFASPEVKDHVAKYGAVEGLEHTLQRLAEHTALTYGDDAKPALEIRRTFAAPRDLVFRAWTEPERMAQWLGPHDFTTISCRLDPVPGGTYRACIRSSKGQDHWMSGVYREVIAPYRLVFTFAWDEADGSRGHETIVFVSFDEVDGQTEMTFRQATFASVESRDSHRGGWSECFERLGAFVTSN